MSHHHHTHCDGMDPGEFRSAVWNANRANARHGEECECSRCNPPLVLCETCGEDVDECACSHCPTCHAVLDDCDCDRCYDCSNLRAECECPKPAKCPRCGTHHHPRVPERCSVGPVWGDVREALDAEVDFGALADLETIPGDVAGDQ